MRFVIVCFVFLALAFYQLSGGANFVPRSIERQALADTGKVEAPKPVAQRSKPAGKVAVTAAAETREEPVVLTAASRIDADNSAVVAASVLIRPDTTLETPEITLVSLEENPALYAAPAIQPSAQATASSTTRPATPQVVEPQPSATDIRRVSGNRVNLRAGPGTAFSVLTSLVRDTEVEVLADSGDGWVQLRALDGGPTGWMADYLLTN